jgi:hypothetical protein
LAQNYNPLAKKDGDCINKVCEEKLAQITDLENQLEQKKKGEENQLAQI